MDYRKLIEDYKNGTLDEAQEKQVAADIEKHEAISDYLMESAEIPGLEEISLSSGEGALSESEAERGSSDTAAQIRKLIRRAFVKAGVIVGTAVLALTLAVLFLLPRFVDCFYYDPCEIAGVTPNGIETNRMTLDMAVWSELHLPGTYRDMVMCEREGYGSYSIYVPQTSSYNNSFTDVAGKLTRNKLTFYNPNVFKKDVPVTFGRVSGIFDNGSEWSLPSDNRFYRAYVTFDKVMSYKELVAWCDANPAYSPDWCAMCRKTDELYSLGLELGFIYDDGCTEMGFDSEKYPLLSIFSVYVKNNVGETFHIPEEDMTQHVVSLLRYSEDHREFAEMMNLTRQEGEYAALADSIEQDGIYVYGFSIVGTGEEIRSLAQADHIAGIYTEHIA
jgi:Methionine synthase I, cobalamin-binding domain